MTEDANAVTPLEAALSANVPRGYADYVYVQIGYGDVSISFHHLGKPVGLITLPHGLAKALAAQLTTSMKHFQDGTGLEIFTPAELEERIKEAVKK